MIAIGHSLGMVVVAEGIEEVTQLDYLRNYQCDIIQGYLFSRPLKEEHMEEYLVNNKVKIKKILYKEQVEDTLVKKI
jgi:EAL domain-containing protein (putative c-di-GMP-specific phosphodiesterase class I)